MLELSIPPNAVFVFDLVIELANFQIIPTKLILEKYMGLKA